jgi:hypothetical protein
MKKHRFTDPQRFAVWKHYGCKCHWCGQPLKLWEMHIDHFIPEYVGNKPIELEKVRKMYGLSSSFVLNDYCNWLPSHSYCNRDKGKEPPLPIPRAAHTLKRMARDADATGVGIRVFCWK